MNGYGYGYEVAPILGGIGNGYGDATNVDYSLSHTGSVTTMYSTTPPPVVVDDLLHDDNDQSGDTLWPLYVAGITGFVITGVVMLGFVLWRRQPRVMRKPTMINPMWGTAAPRKTVWTNNDTHTTNVN